MLNLKTSPVLSLQHQHIGDLAEMLLIIPPKNKHVSFKKKTCFKKKTDLVLFLEHQHIVDLPKVLLIIPSAKKLQKKM